MRYVPPHGVSNPDAPYINGNPATGQQGSIPPAQALEHPMREVVNVIIKSGQTPLPTNLLQLTEGVRSQRLNYAEDTQSDPNLRNNLIVAYDPPITAYHRGLTLHVRVRHTNTDRVQINAGAGNAPIRKMNGADVGPGELPIGCVATLIYDGAAFQLSNFVGAGGGDGTDIITVNIPYTVDVSPTPGTIIARFTPPMTNVDPGDILAVRVKHTAPGPTVMMIDAIAASFDLLPNGGGPMLQGDIVADDVVQFFYDGVALRFMPNPEINAPVTYTVGPSQQFPTIDEAMNILKRKIIGANGHVTLQLSAGVINGPINVAHPSGDRLTIAGAMIGNAPHQGNFLARGNTPAQKAQDAIQNLDMLRTRYGTEIRVADRGGPLLDYGIQNSGAGRITFANLLIVGTSPPIGQNSEWWQVGVHVDPGLGCVCTNVSISGCHGGFNVNGAMLATECFATGCTYVGFHVTGTMETSYCGAFGSTVAGYYAVFGKLLSYFDHSLMNDIGLGSNSSAGVNSWFSTTTGNAVWDLYAYAAASIIMVMPSTFLTADPEINTTGNLGSTIATANAYRPEGTALTERGAKAFAALRGFALKP